MCLEVGYCEITRDESDLLVEGQEEVFFYPLAFKNSGDIRNW